MSRSGGDEAHAQVAGGHVGVVGMERREAGVLEKARVYRERERGYRGRRGRRVVILWFVWFCGGDGDAWVVGRC